MSTRRSAELSARTTLSDDRHRGEQPGRDPGGEVADAVLTAGLGVVLTAVLESGLDVPEPRQARHEAGVGAVEEVLAAGPVVVEPLVAGVLQALETPPADLIGSTIDPAELVTPQLLRVAQQLPAAQRARLAELAKAQYGLCGEGHRRTVRIVDSGRHARTQLVCRSCDPETS